MQKKGISIRITDQQLEQLDQLVEYYIAEQNDQTRMNSFNTRISRASVIELLIRDRYNKLFLKMG